MSAMVRIRANIRDEIISNLLKKKYLADDLELEKHNEKVAELKKALEAQAYKACFTDDQIKKMESLPKGWLPMASHGKIRIEDPENPENYTEEYARWADSSYDNSNEGYRPVPFKNTPHGGGYYMNVITTDHPYVKAKKAYEEAWNERETKARSLMEARNASSRKISTIIESVTTIKRLLEIWPEVHEFLPELVAGEAGAVPAEMISDINKEFGIEPKSK